MNGIRAQIFTFVGTIISAIAVFGVDIKFSANMFENFVRLNSSFLVLIYFFGSQIIFVGVLVCLIKYLVNNFSRKGRDSKKNNENEVNENKNVNNKKSN